MNIIIQKMSLTNFKCFRQQEFEFNPDITTISGRNGIGKTTIADAIMWCLFGKNSAGQTDFELKTRGDKGDIIPHLEHSVELTLSVDGSTVTLKRTLKENWVKKRGAEEQVFKNNSTECMVNGDVLGPTDYKKYISSLISEDIFKAVTNPAYFTGLKWQEQREFLTRLAGDIDSNLIANTQELKDLLAELTNNNEDIIAYRKHISYQMKGIKEKLAQIPIRLQEQQKALPEELNWCEISKRQAELKVELGEIESNIRQLQSGSGADLKREELRKKITELQKKVDETYQKASEEVSKARSEHNQRLSDAQIKFNDALNNQKLMEQTIEADNTLIERIKEVDYEARLQELRDQWPTSKFEVDPDAGYCPTCGQPLPEEQIHAKVAEMRNKFNLQREEKIKQLNEAAAKIKKGQADAQEELQNLEKKLSLDNSKLDEIKNNINIIFAEKAQIEKEKVLTIEEALAGTEYAAYSQQIKELREQIDAVCDDDNSGEELSKLTAKKEELVNENNSILAQLSTQYQYNRGLELIDGIKKEEKELIRQLSEFEKKEDVARQFQDTQNTLLESLINEHFKETQWKLFRTVNNGGEPFDEPYCECYGLDGTPYHDGLNQAARLNIGLDIINTLCNHYNVSAPIIIDQAESTLNYLETKGQQIRLQVAQSELTLS